MKLHELCTLFPRITPGDLNSLAEDIKVNGQRDPITTLNGEILDGQNRFEACKLAGVNPVFEEYKGSDPVAFVISKNLSRRHLDSGQRAMIAAELATGTWGGKRQAANLPLDQKAITTAEAAEKLNVSERSTRAARAVKQKSQAVADMVTQGEVSLNAASKATQSSATKLKNAVAKGAEAVKKLAEEQPTRKMQSCTMGSATHIDIYTSAPANTPPPPSVPVDPAPLCKPVSVGFDPTNPAGQFALQWMVREIDNFCATNKANWNKPPPPMPCDLVKAIRNHFVDFMEE